MFQGTSCFYTAGETLDFPCFLEINEMQVGQASRYFACTIGTTNCIFIRETCQSIECLNAGNCNSGVTLVRHMLCLTLLPLPRVDVFEKIHQLMF